MRTFHLPLPEELHEALRQEATAERRPATEVVRDALVRWIHERRHLRVADEIERFAIAEAGSGLDLDPDLEDVGIEHLLAGESA